MAKRICNIEDCGQPHRARGYCMTHYNEWHYHRREPLAKAEGMTACPVCGGEIPPKRGSGPTATYCSAPCRREAAKVAPSAANRAARRSESQRIARAERPDRACLQCLTPISGSESAKRIYCSTRCSKRATFLRETRPCTVVDCERVLLAKGLCRKHYNAQHPNAKTWKKNGDPEVRRAALRRKTQKRRAARFDPEAEDIDRDQIGERDGWACGLCGQRVRKALTYPHPRSPSLDHITPLSLGGKHVKSNVQISHLACNVAKGNRGGGEQLLLIG